MNVLKSFFLVRKVDSKLFQSTAQVAQIHYTGRKSADGEKKKKHIYLSRKRIPLQTSTPHVKGMPRVKPPPDFETVAFKPLPAELEVNTFQRNGDLTKKTQFLWHVKWQQQRDARRRATATYYGDLKLRLSALQFNGHLPVEVKQMADVELATLPKYSDQRKRINRCVVTNRPRGKRVRWRVSRFVFRKAADHGQMAGCTRAFWGVNNDKNMFLKGGFTSNHRNRKEEIEALKF